MEKAVGALRVLQTFWGSTEPPHHPSSSQTLSAPQSGITVETPSGHRYHELVKREEGDQDLANVYRPAETPETRQQDAKFTDSRAHLTHPACQDAGSVSTYLASTPPTTSQESRAGPAHPEGPDVACTNARLETSREVEAVRERSFSSQPREILNSAVIGDPKYGNFSFGDYVVRRGDLTNWTAPGAEYGRYTDEEVRSQPDIIFEDGTLTMPLDGPHLRDVIRRIEKDRSLCFKMRWYIARHVRHHYTTELKPSTQHYRRRVYRNHNFSRQHDKSEQLVSLRDKPFNRLDFEATRIQEHFTRNQPGFQIRTITQVLQRAYDQYGWDEAVTDEDVDDVLLLHADSDLRHWANARRMTSPYQEVPAGPIVQQPPKIIAAEPTLVTPSPSMYGAASPLHHQQAESSFHYSMLLQTPASSSTNAFPPQPSSSSLRRETEHPASHEPSAREEVALLRAEIRELKAEVEAGRQFRESFVEEQRASQEALMAEMHSMLEAAEHGRKRKRERRSDKKQFSRRKSKKMRKYVQKLKELDAQTDGSLSSSSASAAEDSPGDAGS